jgi:hypothetical protein
MVAQAFTLEGARSVVALPSTYARGRSTTSNVRWSYGHVTIPRHLRDLVVTEYGVADLRGRADADVIAAMLAVADSRFQAELLARAEAAGKIDRRHQIPPACRDNTPDRIEHALAPARDAGLFPAFPFGSEFTEVEQRLLPALETLKAASAPKIARLLLRGLGGARGTNAVREALQRLGLDRPGSPRDLVYAALVRGVLAPRRG